MENTDAKTIDEHYDRPQREMDIEKLAIFLFDCCKNTKELRWEMLTEQSKMPYRTEAAANCEAWKENKLWKT